MRKALKSPWLTEISSHSFVWKNKTAEPSELDLGWKVTPAWI